MFQVHDGSLGGMGWELTESSQTTRHGAGIGSVSARTTNLRTAAGWSKRSVS